MNEIFYEFNQIKGQSDLSSTVNIEIILHFLAKVGDNLMLYETKQSISKSKNSRNDQEVIDTLKNVFQNVDPSISLIKGKIREIFLSFSS